MRCLSIREPWCWLIRQGLKSIENRSWRSVPSYRGWVALHSPKTIDRDAIIQRVKLPAEYVTGAITGLAYLQDACLYADRFKQTGEFRKALLGKWAGGPVCLWFSDAMPIEPVPFKGRLGLFEMPMSVVSQLDGRLLDGDDFL